MTSRFVIPPAMSLAQAHAALTASGQPWEMETIAGTGVRGWKRGPQSLADIFDLGQAFPDREFIVCGHHRVTYAAFGRAVGALTQHFVAEGLAKGDRVAILARNRPEWPLAFFAATLAGAIAVPLNGWWTTAELELVMADSGASILVCDRTGRDLVAQRRNSLPRLRRILVADGDAAIHPSDLPLEEVVGPVEHWAALPAPSRRTVAIAPEDDATLFYTSGTTGRPKGALGSHRNIATHVMTTGLIRARAALMAGRPLSNPDPRQNPQKTHLLAAPLFHVTGCNAALAVVMANGGKLVLMQKWDPDEGLALIEREKVNATGGVPTIALQLAEHPDRTAYDLSSLETVSYGGAPSPLDLAGKIGSVLAAVPGNGWGMTETSGLMTGHLGGEYLSRPSSCGPAVPVADLQIRAENGRTVLPPGAVGELWCRGPQVIRAYWNRPEETAQTFKEGWLRTGDIARLDEEGYCYILDRAKDMLIRGGENIYCIEVENALHDHPAIQEAAVIGLPHRTLGEEPAAVVSLRAGHRTDSADLTEFLASRLARFKIPVRFLIREAALPRNPAGKVLKAQLRTLFEEAPVADAC